MKKKLIILLVVILLSGCDVDYKLNFNDEQIIENISLTIPISEERKIDNLKKITAYAIFDAISYYPYNTSYGENENNFIANYNYDYEINNFGRAYYVNECFDAVNFSKNEQANQYSLMTSVGFKCMLFDYQPIDNLKVTITTNHEVIEHNASSSKNGEYVWIINENNASDTQIKIIFGDVKERTFLDVIKENIVAIGIIGGLILLVGLTALIIVIKAKKNNEI